MARAITTQEQLDARKAKELARLEPTAIVTDLRAEVMVRLQDAKEREKRGSSPAVIISNRKTQSVMRMTLETLDQRDELLVALSDLLAACSDEPQADGYCDRKTPPLIAVTKARAVLAKAKGEG